MAGIVSTGIGSGLDISGIVQQLVAAEGAPVESRLARREASAQAKLSAFGGIKSALADFQSKAEAIKDIDGVLARKATTSDPEFFSASASSTAQPASYSFEVVRLAQAQKLSSGSFVDGDTAVGTGTLSIEYDGSVMNLDITVGNESLSAIRDAINGSETNPGVSASIVNADSGSYLILTGDATGAAKTIKVTQSGGDGGLSALEYDPGSGLNSLTESQAAQDALVRIDGLDVRSETNSFTDAIEGVTIDVTRSTSGALETLSVTNDRSATSQSIENFIDSYNSLIELYDSLTSYDQETNISGALIGDSTLRGIVTEVRKQMTSAVESTGPYSLLTDIGVELQVDGKLKVDSTKLGEALDSDFVRVGQLFSNEDGFAVRAYDTAKNFLDSGGILEARTQGLNSTIDNIGEQRESLNDRLASLETRLLRQYNALDGLLQELNNTSNFLASQLQNLPGFTRPESN